MKMAGFSYPKMKENYRKTFFAMSHYSENWVHRPEASANLFAKNTDPNRMLSHEAMVRSIDMAADTITDKKRAEVILATQKAIPVGNICSEVMKEHTFDGKTTNGEPIKYRLYPVEDKTDLPEGNRGPLAAMAFIETRTGKLCGFMHSNDPDMQDALKKIRGETEKTIGLAYDDHINIKSMFGETRRPEDIRDPGKHMKEVNQAALEYKAAAPHLRIEVETIHDLEAKVINKTTKPRITLKQAGRRSYEDTYGKDQKPGYDAIVNIDTGEILEMGKLWDETFNKPEKQRKARTPKKEPMPSIIPMHTYNVRHVDLPDSLKETTQLDTSPEYS